MRIASIDIGSNTVLLLIADVINSKMIPLVNEYRIPRISTGLAKTGFIADSSIEKLYKILEEYKSIIDRHNCEKVIVNGTQALRVAKNSRQIKEEIKTRFGFELNIIAGETEALYAFKGALSSFSDNKKYAMIDIGGASTEIVLGNKNEIFFRKSFPIGVVTSKEKFLRTDPTTEDELKMFETELEKTFNELSQIDFSNATIIAVAGTPTTITALKLGLTEYSEEKVERTIITKNDLKFYISQFKKYSYTEIETHFSPIITGREDVILAGSLILLHVIKVMNKTDIYVSGRGLRYGAIL